MIRVKAIRVKAIRVHRRGRVLLATAAVALGALAATAATRPAQAASGLNPSQFHGVVWSMWGDNYQNGPIIPAGLSSSDSYATVKATTDAIVNSLEKNLPGIHSIRIHINEPTVLTSWWNSYRATLDELTARGLTVSLTYSFPKSHPTGPVVNMTTWWQMWDTVIQDYNSNPNIYFLLANEPAGYSASAWANVAASWLARYPQVARNRVMIPGAGYETNIQAICSDSRLNGTYVTLHYFASQSNHFSNNWSYNQWVSDYKSKLGSCGNRVVTDAFGAPMDDGRDYNNRSSTDTFVRYFQAVTDTQRALGIGSILWVGPGGLIPRSTILPGTDYFSIEYMHGSGPSLYLTNENQSAADRLVYAWGTNPPPPPPGGGPIKSGLAGKCADDNNGSAVDGTAVQIWDCNGGPAQNWTYANGTLTINGKCMDVTGQGTANLTPVEIWDCNGGANQQWTPGSNGSLVSAQSGKCLDDPGASTTNGTQLIIYQCNGAANQQWTLP